MKRLAVLVPALNESRRVETLIAGLRSIQSALPSSEVQVVLVLIDDGSRDDTFNVFEKKLSEEKIAAKLIRFVRNFGKDSAVFAGMQEMEADFYVIIDADGQTPFTLVPEMYRCIEKENIEVVYAVKKQEPYHWLRRSLTALFFFIVRKLGIRELKKGSSDFILFSRIVRDRILLMQENGIVVRNLVRWLGMASREITFNPGESDVTTFTFKKLFLLGIRSIISFSHILRINFFIALGYWIFSFFYGILILYNKFTGRIVVGLSTMTLLTLISFGLMFFMIAIIGEYLIIFFEEIKNRPRFFIDRIRDIE
ncbi:glycosyltransferase [candidate division KSB1 bacterium]|nr:glycosyltransferase [Candidatus Aminicenantes bacterium]RQW03665.1 MAG: glycosyltransferase [candidate division KSB1 bacterium]